MIVISVGQLLLFVMMAFAGGLLIGAAFATMGRLFNEDLHEQRPPAMRARQGKPSASAPARM